MFAKLALIGLTVALLVAALGASLPEYEKSNEVRHLPPNVSSYAGALSSEYFELEAQSEGSVIGGILPHHIPTALPLLEEWYQKANLPNEPLTFVILGPSHDNLAQAPIASSKKKWRTPLAELAPNLELIEDLVSKGGAAFEEFAFDKEHSIGSQILLISKYFPKAQVAPLIFRSDVPPAMVERLAQVLNSRSLRTPNLVVLASVDLTHYVDPIETRVRDDKTIEKFLNLQAENINDSDTDSKYAVRALLEYLKLRGIAKGELLNKAVSQDLSGNGCTSCTGYATIIYRESERSNKLKGY